MTMEVWDRVFVRGFHEHVGGVQLPDDEADRLRCAVRFYEVLLEDGKERLRAARRAKKRGRLQ